MNDMRKEKTEREKLNEANGIKVDVDFQVMVENNMNNLHKMVPVIFQILIMRIARSCRSVKDLCLCQEKAYLCQRTSQWYNTGIYILLGEIDCISCVNPTITVHECKFKVDGITKYIDN